MISPALRILRRLRATPYFRGRDRAMDALSRALPPELELDLEGIRLTLDTREHTQRDLAVGGHLEPRTVAQLRRRLRPGATCIDIGAHAGVLAMEAARAVGPTGSVIAVDPQPANCDRLMRNAALNGFDHIVTVAAAAGETDGWVRLRYQRESDRSRLSLCAYEPSATPYTFETPLMRLDTLMSRLRVDRVAVLKIDVEGYELQVLRGCGERLRDVGAIVLELLPGADHHDTLDLLRAAGFELQDVAGARFTSVDALPEHNLLAVR